MAAAHMDRLVTCLLVQFGRSVWYRRLLRQTNKKLLASFSTALLLLAPPHMFMCLDEAQGASTGQVQHGSPGARPPFPRSLSAPLTLGLPQKPSRGRCSGGMTRGCQGQVPWKP